MINKETLLYAKEILRKNGWTRGTMRNYDGECCAVGAIAIACGENPDSVGFNGWLNENSKDFEYVAQCAIKANIENENPSIARGVWWGADIPAITYFNDHNAKSVEDIEALYDCAIERMEN